MSYKLHYAPDNASLVVRLALEEMGIAYDTVLVDRTVRAQRGPAYLALNPNGLIPVLETPDGPIFETAAILLWLGDRHRALVPAPHTQARGTFLKWLFFLSNTLHTDLRGLFYPEVYIGPEPAFQDALRAGLRLRLLDHLRVLDIAAPEWPVGPTMLDLYLACQLRWLALYPAATDRSWFSLDATPHLLVRLSALEHRPATQAAQAAEGLGPTPFTSPQHPVPPEGSAT